jgi:hypothetical protein
VRKKKKPGVKFGVYLPVQIVDDLDYLAKLTDMTRSKVLLTVLGDSVGFLAEMLRDAEKRSKETGVPIELVTHSKAIAKKYESQFEEAMRFRAKYL